MFEKSEHLRRGFLVFVTMIFFSIVMGSTFVLVGTVSKKKNRNTNMCLLKTKTLNNKVVVTYKPCKLNER